MPPVSDRYAVPDWLTDYVSLWVDRLELGNWKITLRIDHCVQDDPFIQALTEQRPQLNEAKIIFRGDVEDTEEWRITIVHECLHVKHGRIDHFLERAVFPEMFTGEGQRLVREGYSQHYESYVHEMANILYRMWKWKEEAVTPPPRTRNKPAKPAKD